MKKRILSLFMALLFILNICIPSKSYAFAVTATATATAIAGTTAVAGTTTAVAGGGTIAGFVGGGVALTTAELTALYTTLTSLIINGAMALKMSGDISSDIDAMNMIQAFNKSHEINGFTSLQDVYKLRKLEYGGVEYDVFELNEVTRNYLLEYYYGLQKGENVTEVVSPNALYETGEIASGYAVLENGSLSPLAYYDRETGNVYLATYKVNEILSLAYGSLTSPADFYEGYDVDQFYAPVVSSSDTERSVTQIDYYNNEMWRAYDNFEAFVNFNPISTVIKIPNDLQPTNDAVIDTWVEVVESSPIEFKVFPDDDAPLMNYFYENNGTYDKDFTITPVCPDCSFRVSKDALSYRQSACDHYVAVFPRFEREMENHYTLSGIGIRAVVPYQYYSSNFEWFARDYYIDSSALCTSCLDYYESKFLVRDESNMSVLPALGTQSYQRTYTLPNDVVIPNLVEEGTNWAISVPSGATYSDVANGDAEINWVDLNSIEYVDKGLIDESQFVELPVVENTGEVKDQEGESVVVPPGDNPDYGDFEEMAERIQEWIQGGITISPDVMNGLSVGATGAFSSLGDAVSYGTFTGIQMSQQSNIINSLQQALNPSSSPGNSANAPDNPNLLDLILLIFRVLISCILLVARALVFVATLVAIPSTTGFLPAYVVQGVAFAKGLAWGSLNLYDLVVWFVTIMFGIKVVGLIKHHYRL